MRRLKRRSLIRTGSTVTLSALAGCNVLKGSGGGDRSVVADTRQPKPRPRGAGPATGPDNDADRDDPSTASDDSAPESGPSSQAFGDRTIGEPGRGARARPRPALVADPKGVLDLPEGFSYRVLQQSGAAMSDGYKVPGRPDAMGCFAGKDGSIVLMRNHECFEGDRARSPYLPDQPAPPEAYDPAGTGGVTRLVLDPASLAVRHSNLVLCGTFWNCAGGLSPWGWLSCEETLSVRHGYVFLCDSSADSVRAARPIRGYGRFRHEAAAVDPDTHIAYLTEDQIDGCFYRFVPRDRAQPFEGTLQALAVQAMPRFNTGELRPGARVPITWVDIDHPEPEGGAVRDEAHQRGAALVVRGEGMWLGKNEAYVCATAGGPLGRGQVLRIGFGEHASLDVLCESTDPEELDMPDNVCVSPHGSLFVAEDGGGDNHIRRVALDGTVRPFARNALSSAEFAGPCFSPDGTTLFVNIQEDGMTFAIRGDFDQLAAADLHAPKDVFEDDTPDWARGARGLGGGLAMLALAAFTRRRRRARG